MFFELHAERKIGYKRLSDADLGIGTTSHQTHIGLAAYVLTFLPNEDSVLTNSIFIYEDSFEFLDVNFSRIQRESGKYDAPKIRSGGIDSISVTSAIRNIVKSKSTDLKWFLFWFGLKSEKVVFMLLNNTSDDYKMIVELGLNLDDTKKGAKVVQGKMTNDIAAFIEKRVNENGLATIKELEVESQIGLIKPDKKYKIYDIEKANENFKMIGRLGEELINSHFMKRMYKNDISYFRWYNEEKESGFPYDFHIETQKGNIIYLDVKTTKFDFNQRMVFSSQEIEYISNTEYNYHIYRVYFDNKNEPHVRVCKECKTLASQIHTITNGYKRNLIPVNADLRSAKLALSPSNELLSFNQGISLQKLLS